MRIAAQTKISNRASDVRRATSGVRRASGRSECDERRAGGGRNKGVLRILAPFNHRDLRAQSKVTDIIDSGDVPCQPVIPSVLVLVRYKDNEVLTGRKIP
jgi:hypothetical protein